MKTGTHRRANVHMTHLMKMVEMRMVMEAIDENKAYASANKKRRPPIPWVRIRIVRDWVHKHAAVRALDDLPRSIALQTCPSHDLLHRSVNIRLSRHSAAIRSGVNICSGCIVVHLCKRGRGKTQGGKHYSQPK